MNNDQRRTLELQLQNERHARRIAEQRHICSSVRATIMNGRLLLDDAQRHKDEAGHWHSEVQKHSTRICSLLAQLGPRQ